MSGEPLTIDRNKQTTLSNHALRKLVLVLADGVDGERATVRREIVRIAIIRDTNGSTKGDIESSDGTVGDSNGLVTRAVLHRVRKADPKGCSMIRGHLEECNAVMRSLRVGL